MVMQLAHLLVDGGAGRSQHFASQAAVQVPKRNKQTVPKKAFPFSAESK